MALPALFTDFYELTMMQGYFLSGRNPSVVFEMFFRKNPFDGGYAVFAGLADVLESLENIRFTASDTGYLDKSGLFRPEFLSCLENFSFGGNVFAAKEGDVVFQGEPILRVHGGLMECQFIESLVLNIINFQTLIATKASRIKTASKNGSLLEFGLRRAQGPDGALSASRAAYIGGVSATSNTEAGRRYGIPAKGTMAHSWVMSFDSEYEAFKTYADHYPGESIFLIDTYDTLGSGIDNAVKVGLELKQKGYNFGVRLDSGDLCYLSVKVREKLDNAGLTEAFITVSNDLNEEIIMQLLSDNAPINLWGIGTQLVTGGSHSSLPGVYKLCARETAGGFLPVMKVSNNPGKTTNPGIKQVHRFLDNSGSPLGDLITLEDETISPGSVYRFHHPSQEAVWFDLEHYASIRTMLTPVMREGRRLGLEKKLPEIRDYAAEEIAKLDRTCKRLVNPHTYKVSISETLKTVKTGLVEDYLKNR
ncbi:MAG: nicotinate phosphoribosyltransferase [Spirochaetales bacterium]|nr:MAG: nicotinate phosphoribosyltransferase [Spirochaetales bacterium]